MDKCINKAFACINNNDDIRKKSSSGGMFYLFAKHILACNGIVFGAKFNEKFEVEHAYVEDVKNIELLMTSKYVQSKIGDSFIKVKDFLKEGKLVLFTGTPCQVAGLIKYLKENKSNIDNLLTIDFVCHGVPSPFVWNEYVKEISKEKKIKNINFRDKKRAWKNFSLNIEFENGYKTIKSKDYDPYILGFLKNIYLRPSCFNCKFKGINRVSDITLGDLWHIEQITSCMSNDDKGISLLLLNSSKGRVYLNKVNDNTVTIKDIDINRAIQCNKNAIQSVPVNEKRKTFFKEYNMFLKRYKGKTPMIKFLKLQTRESMDIEFKKLIKRILNK